SRARRRICDRPLARSMFGRWIVPRPLFLFGSRPLVKSRLAARARCDVPWDRGQRLDADIVFLVGTPDFNGEGFGDPFGDFELGGGVENADGADVLLVDTAAPANHRQQPARFGVLSSPDGCAKPDAALFHDVTLRRLSRLRSGCGCAVVATRHSAVLFAAAIVAGSARALAGIENVLGRRQPRAIKPGQRRGD